jgi:hypothetical protein
MPEHGSLDPRLQVEDGERRRAGGLLDDARDEKRAGVRSESQEVVG